MRSDSGRDSNSVQFLPLKITKSAGPPVASTPTPSSRIIRAVASREIDVAIAWGPLAGYYAALQTPALRVVPVAEATDGAWLPMTFDISLAVRAHDRERRDMLDRIIERRRGDIDAVLADYHVPRAKREGA